MADSDVAFLLEQVVTLARACDTVPIARKWDTRRTWCRRRLMSAKRILTSITGRLRWGLVLCSQQEFAAQMRASLLDFHVSILDLSRLLGNRGRCDGLLDLVRAAGELAQRI